MLFRSVCYPKTFKNSNRFGVSTLLVMVKRGHEVDLEYSKKEILDKMNSFFGYSVVEKLKFISFDDQQKIISNDIDNRENVANKKYQNKINDVKNDKIKKSLIRRVIFILKHLGTGDILLEIIYLKFVIQRHLRILIDLELVLY